MPSESKLSRRNFIKYSVAGAAGTVLMPSFLNAAPTAKAKKKSANDTINIGCIGLGQQSMYLVSGFMSIPGVRVVAGADVYDIKRQRFEKRVKDYYSSKSQKVNIKTYEKYEDLLERDDIDGVIIATPDHYHAIIAIAACRAGKDVYLEKPMTFTIYEGQELVKAVRQNNRILQVGSQQRSDPEFIHVTNLVREGKLGKISFVKVWIGDGPRPYDLPAQPVPEGLDWDRWLGPLSKDIHYNERLDPVVSLTPEVNESFWAEWRLFKEMGGGMTTDWGAHMLDVTQWALGKDRSGPVEIIPPGAGHYDHLTYIYDNGIVVSRQPFDGGKLGCRFYGENGWIQVQRGEVMASDPAFMPQKNAGENAVAYETNVPHMETFINSMRSRIDPNVPVEIGHSSCTMCTLGNIAYDLGRPLKWNPIVEKFMDDPEATKYMHYEYRKGYSL